MEMVIIAFAAFLGALVGGVFKGNADNGIDIPKIGTDLPVLRGGKPKVFAKPNGKTAPKVNDDARAYAKELEKH